MSVPGGVQGIGVTVMGEYIVEISWGLFILADNSGVDGWVLV